MFVIGTIVNMATIWRMPQKEVIATCLAWEFAIFMQLWDAVLWKMSECSKEKEVISSVAMAFNVMQPVVSLFLFLLLKNSGARKSVAVAIVTIYLIYMLIDLSRMKPIQCVKSVCDENKKNCNLDYSWWGDSNVGGVMYLIALLSVFLLLLRPLKFAAMQCAVILVTFFIALFGFQDGHPSVWCFFAAFAPFFVGLSRKFAGDS